MTQETRKPLTFAQIAAGLEQCGTAEERKQFRALVAEQEALSRKMVDLLAGDPLQAVKVVLDAASRFDFSRRLNDLGGKMMENSARIAEFERMVREQGAAKSSTLKVPCPV